MSLRKHHNIVLLIVVLTCRNRGCVDLVTESVKDGVGDAISGAVADAIGSMLEVNEYR
ncbi:MAG: hypothetical protein JSU63_13395 [Phycisphaerales bacterium]|nr:MAG: hypothetical protein JSU63_13395 [Phycisphaerales bacterium]